MPKSCFVLWKCLWLLWGLAMAKEEVAAIKDVLVVSGNVTEYLTSSSLILTQAAASPSSTQQQQQIDFSLVPSIKLMPNLPGKPQPPPQQTVPSAHQSPLLTNTASATPPADSQGSDRTLEIVKRLEGRLKYIRNEELCVPEIQGKFDLMDFVTRPRNDEEQVQKMATKLEGKLKRALATLETLEQAATGTASKLGLNSETVVYPCPSRTPPKVRHTTLPISYNRDQIEIVNNHAAPGGVVMVEEDFSGQFYKQLKGLQFSTRARGNGSSSTSTTPSAMALNFKRQYLLSPHDNAIDNSCPFYFDTRSLRNVFVSSIRNKRVLLLVDYGNSLNVDQLELTKAMAKQIVSLLSDSDYLQIITIADAVDQFRLDQGKPVEEDCEGGSDWKLNGLFPTSVDNKIRFLKFIDRLEKTKENTNHSLGFQAAFDFLSTALNATDEKADDFTFLYVSRGLLSMAEAKTVLETIATGQSRLKRPVVINTCAIIIDEKRIMYERQFLTDITVQDYAKYSIDTPWLSTSDQIKAIEGHMYLAMKRQSNALFVNATAVYAKLFLTRPPEATIEVHRPVVDTEMNRDLIVSVTKAVKDVGVVGLDLYLHDLAEDVLYYNKHPDSYAFMIDHRGQVIVHPTQTGLGIVEGAYLQEFVYPTDVLFIEQNGRFFDESLRTQMLEMAEGKRQFNDVVRNGTVTYTWRRTDDKFYIICIVTYYSNAAPRHPVELKRIHSNAHNRDVYPSPAPMDALLYHRLDLLMAMMKRGQGLSPGGSGSFGGGGQKLSLCRNFKQISTFDAGTLFLSPSAFQSPFLFAQNNNNIRRTVDGASVEAELDADEQQMAMDRIQTLMAYLKDRTNLLANPGLLPQVRNDVVALSYIINHLRWKHLKREHLQQQQQHQPQGGHHQHAQDDGRAAEEDESLRRAIIRRYVATMNGVLEVYPGVQLDGALEPRRRPWFVKALMYPGKVVMTEPYLDAGGAGYIVSIAYTIFEGKPMALHNAQKDLPVAVIGLDLTLGYVYKLVAESSGGVCGPGPQSMGAGAGSSSTPPPPMRCFLIDDKGYLVAHPSVLEPILEIGKRGPLEHVTHKEPLVANDLLNHKVLVEKKSCNVYGNRTTQRYYQFNTSMVEVLTNVQVHGERNKYYIAAVPGTNVFLTIVNASTEREAFCPCSMVDRLCFYCYRMEHTECECPCECPLGVVPEIGREKCYRKGGGSASLNPFAAQNCDLPHVNVEELNVHTVMPIFRYDFDEMEMRSCPATACDQIIQQWECVGVAGCEWCQVDEDGETGIGQPFCTAQASCYSGVRGAASPYGGGQGGGMLGDNQMGATIFIDPLTPPTYSSVGPIAGAIIALCLVVGFAMYCYRQNQEPHLQGQPFEENFYVDSQIENNYDLALNRINFDDPFDENNDGNNSNQNLIPVNNADVAASPYRAPSVYRRPPNADSDHGYSTMTPHDDSENAGFTLADPLLNRGGRGPSHKRASLSDTISINTSVSSPTNYQKHYNVPLRDDVIEVADGSEGVADLRDTGALLAHQSSKHHSPHHVLAPVTVHRQMEAS